MASQDLIKRLSKKAGVLLAMGLLIGILSFYSSCSKNEKYLNHADDVAYVGMQACVECHSDKHSSFIHTGMGLSFEQASQQKSAASFGPEHMVYDSFSNLHYRPYFKGDRLFVEEFEIDGADTIHKYVQEITYIIGSGQHTNSHLIEKNGYVYQAPITFYVQEKKWDLAPGFEGGNNSRFNRILDAECISCHNAMPKMEESSTFKFKTIDQGIDCERCHGPGTLHVDERKNGKGVDVSKYTDYTIVNPRKLTWERQVDVCQRCHLQGLNVLKEGKQFTDFKPGMVLSDYFEIYFKDIEGGSEFDMANHAQRLQESKCFLGSNDKQLKLTCITCHNPHVSVKQTNAELFNAACNNCHQEQQCTEKEAVRRLESNNCVTCHMPLKGPKDIPHVSVHDHKIAIQQEEISEIGVLKGIYAINNSNPDPKTLTQAYLEYWEKFDKNPLYLSKAKELLQNHNYPQLQVKYYYLTEQYAKAVEVNIDEEEVLPWTYFMVGYSYRKLKKNSLAGFYLRKASNEDPTNYVIQLEFLNQLIENRELLRAQLYGVKFTNEWPLDGKMKLALAKVQLLSGELEIGKKLLDKALVLEPKNEKVYEAFANYYRMIGDKKSMQEWARKVLSINPQHPFKELVK